jgi:hypothetical protein
VTFSLKLVKTSAVVRDCEPVATLACYRVTLNEHKIEIGNIIC